MSRRNRRYLLLVCALVVLATVAALAQERGVPRIPQDLVPMMVADNSFPTGNALPLTDGSGRTLDLVFPTLSLREKAGESTVTLSPNPAFLAGLTPDQRVVYVTQVLPLRRPKDGTLTVYTAGVAEHEAPLAQERVVLPKDVASVEALVLSPDGKQLAWNLYSEYDRPGVPLLRRIAPKLAERFPPRGYHEVWVSSFPKGRLQRVAACPEEISGTRWHAPDFPFRVGWTGPSTLVVHYEDKSYRIP